MILCPEWSRNLKGRARIKRDEITGEPLPSIEGEEPEGVVEVVIEYQLPGKPKSMVLKPPLDPATGRSNAMLGFVVYHRGLAVNDFRFLSSPEALDLDWEDPWYSSFRNRNLRRQFEAPAQGFIYVEHFEVRKELLLRPKDLQSFVDLGLEGKSVIAANEQEALKAKIAEFLEGSLSDVH